MLQEWGSHSSPSLLPSLPPSLPPSSAPLNQMLWLSFGAFVCCVKNNGGRSRWNIASAANPYGSEKAACQVQTPLLQAHLEQNHHINCQLMCLHTARINPWEKLVDPGRAVSGRGCVFPARKAAGERCQAKCVDKGASVSWIMQPKAICHVAFPGILTALHVNISSDGCKNSWVAVKVHAGIYEAVITRDVSRAHLHFLLFILDVWTQHAGLKWFRAPRAGQKPWNMSRMTDIYVPELLLLLRRCFQEDTTVWAQVEMYADTDNKISLQWTEDSQQQNIQFVIFFSKATDRRLNSACCYPNYSFSFMNIFV